MKNKFLINCILVALFGGSTQADTLSLAQPNIIFILFDDMGFGQPPCYRNGSEFRTPNLDRLANEGRRFTDAHTAASVCTPTRSPVAIRRESGSMVC